MAIEALSLFDEPRTRRSDPATSRRAANEVWRGWPQLIIDCLAQYGPATDDRICVRLNVDPRRWPSVKSARSRVTLATDPAKRLIVATGEIENGQQVWAHRDFRSWVEPVEIAGGVL